MTTLDPRQAQEIMETGRDSPPPEKSTNGDAAGPTTTNHQGPLLRGASLRPSLRAGSRGGRQAATQDRRERRGAKERDWKTQRGPAVILPASGEAVPIPFGNCIRTTVAWGRQIND
jgi:hypothetical protein